MHGWPEMAGYEPYLLPLLYPDGLPKGIPLPQSPLEEEVVLAKTGASWEDLANRCAKAYGLPLIAQALDRNRSRVAHPAGRGPAGEPYFVVDEARFKWFMLEHPSHLPVYDALGQAGQQPALARPTLFNRWFNEAGLAQPGSALPACLPESEARPLDRYLLPVIEAENPSDWHLEPGPDGYRSRIRANGQLIEKAALSRKEGRWLIDSLLNRAGVADRPAGSAIDSSFTIQAGKESHPARLSLVPALHGEALVIRFHRPDLPDGGDLDALGFSEAQLAHIEKGLARPDGLWLVAGPTGAGKTTTLHALLHRMVSHYEKVLAVEDPVEQALPGVQQVQVDTDRGRTFERVLRGFMRQSPDSILIGEIRDPETAAMALQAAQTGHRVLSSIHADDSEGIYRRFADLEIPRWHLIEVVELFVHQRLVPLLCPHCRRERTAIALEEALIKAMKGGRTARIHESIGCDRCQNGVSGRTAIYSVSGIRGRQQTRQSLRAAACKLFESRQIGLKTLVSYLPGELRREFPLCQL
jgi:Tfp pilus assembly pilus retraction ATPase PilT